MAPPKNKVDGEGKGKAIVITRRTRVLRSMDQKTPGYTRRSSSASRLVQLEYPVRKRKKKSEAGGPAKKKIKKEIEEEEVAVEVQKEENESAEEKDDATEGERKEDEDDFGKQEIVIVEHCKQCESSEERANQVKEGLEEAVPGIIVSFIRHGFSFLKYKLGYE